MYASPTESPVGNKLFLCVSTTGGAYGWIQTDFSANASPKDTIYLLSKYLLSKMGGGRAYQK
jgi:hypothetical protein